MCGSCLLILQSLRVNMAILTHTTTSVWPETPVDAAIALEGTRWEPEIRVQAVREVYEGFDLRSAPFHGFAAEAIQQAADDALRS